MAVTSSHVSCGLDHSVHVLVCPFLAAGVASTLQISMREGLWVGYGSIGYEQHGIF